MEVVQNGGREGRQDASLITLFLNDNINIVIVQIDVITALLVTTWSDANPGQPRPLAQV